MPTAAEKEPVLQAFERRGYPRAEGDAVVQFESGWDPRAMNRWSKAAGLIQFMPRTLKGLGWPGTQAEFCGLSIADQAPWIDRFLQRVPTWQVPGDGYLAVFAPRHVGVPSERVIFEVGSLGWKRNRLLRSGTGGGPITAGSVRGVILRMLSRS